MVMPTSLLPMEKLPEVWHHSTVSWKWGMMDIDTAKPWKIDQFLLENSGRRNRDNKIEILPPQIIQKFGLVNVILNKVLQFHGRA